MKLVPIGNNQPFEKNFYTNLHDFETRNQDKSESYYRSVSKVLESQLPEDVKMRFFNNFLNKFIGSRKIGEHKPSDKKNVNVEKVEAPINIVGFNQDCTIKDDSRNKTHEGPIMVPSTPIYEGPIEDEKSSTPLHKTKIKIPEGMSPISEQPTIVLPPITGETLPSYSTDTGISTMPFNRESQRIKGLKMIKPELPLKHRIRDRNAVKVKEFIKSKMFDYNSEMVKPVGKNYEKIVDIDTLANWLSKPQESKIIPPFAQEAMKVLANSIRIDELPPEWENNISKNILRGFVDPLKTTDFKLGEGSVKTIIWQSL